MTDKKNPAAVALGRRGGKAGTGAAKRRSGEHYRFMQERSVAAIKAKRDERKALEAVTAVCQKATP